MVAIMIALAGGEEASYQSIYTRKQFCHAQWLGKQLTRVTTKPPSLVTISQQCLLVVLGGGVISVKDDVCRVHVFILFDAYRNKLIMLCVTRWRSKDI